MKKLALLTFAISILGCGTETQVIEELPPVVETPAPVVLSGERFWLSIAGPKIMAGNVLHDDVDVDPEPINIGGFRYDFDEDLKLYRIDLRLKDGESLGWRPQGVVDHEDIGRVVTTQPIFGSTLLEFDTEYEINMYVQDLACNSSNFEMQFRTKPR